MLLCDIAEPMQRFLAKDYPRLGNWYFSPADVNTKSHHEQSPPSH